MADFTSVTMSGTIKENIELQIAELEMLFSMFPYKGEITLQDENCFLNAQRYLNNTSEDLPHKIEYSVAVAIDEPEVRPSVLHWGALFCFILKNSSKFDPKHLFQYMHLQKDISLRQYTILHTYNWTIFYLFFF